MAPQETRDGLPVTDSADTDIEAPTFGALEGKDVDSLTGRIFLLERHVAALTAAFERRGAQITELRARLAETGG